MHGGTIQCLALAPRLHFHDFDVWGPSRISYISIILKQNAEVVGPLGQRDKDSHMEEVDFPSNSHPIDVGLKPSQCTIIWSACRSFGSLDSCVDLAT